MLALLLITQIKLFADVSHGVFYDSTGNPYCEIYIQIPYNQLIFLKEDTLYKSRFEILCIIRRKKEEYEIAKECSIIVNEYEKTLSEEKFTTSIRKFLQPGKYSVRLIIKDKNSDRKFLAKRKIKIKKLKKEIAVSTLVFKANNMVSPGHCFSYKDTIKVNFVIYSRNKGKLKIKYKIKSKRKKTKDSVFVDITKFLNPVEISFTPDKFQPGVNHIIFYIGKIKIKDSVVVNYPYWLDEERILQLEYVAFKSTIKKILKASPEEREKLWKEFWRKLDPTPGTERNECEEEYFRRVDYANRHFRAGIDGWRTDRGMVYIKFGEPDEIETHPSEMTSKPYEIWRYYTLKNRFVFYREGVRTLTKSAVFIFVDKFGFGDYELVYPKFIW